MVLDFWFFSFLNLSIWLHSSLWFYSFLQNALYLLLNFQFVLRILYLKLFQWSFLNLQHFFRCRTNYAFFFRYLIHFISYYILGEPCHSQCCTIQFIITFSIILFHWGIILSSISRNLYIYKSTLKLQWNFFGRFFFIFNSSNATFSKKILIGDVTVLFIKVCIKTTSVEFLSNLHVFDCFSYYFSLLILSFESLFISFCLFFMLSYEFLS